MYALIHLSTAQILFCVSLSTEGRSAASVMVLASLNVVAGLFYAAGDVLRKKRTP